MTDAEIAWVAGLFEGEGCVSAKRGKGNAHRYQAAVIMTDEDVLVRFAKLVGIGKLYGPYQPVNPKAKPIWRWTTTRIHEVESLYGLIGPWLGHRRRARFEEAIADMRAHPAERFFHKLSTEIHDEIRRRYTAGGITQVALASEFGIHQGMVSTICTATNRHVADQPLPIDVPLLNPKK